MAGRNARPNIRRYHSELCANQAAETRLRILDVAAGLFAFSGYAGTSLADIARAAGVSIETVKLGGPKRQLLLAAVERIFAGSEGIPSLANHAPLAQMGGVAPDASRWSDAIRTALIARKACYYLMDSAEVLTIRAQERTKVNDRKQDYDISLSKNPR